MSSMENSWSSHGGVGGVQPRAAEQKSLLVLQCDGDSEPRKAWQVRELGRLRKGS